MTALRAHSPSSVAPWAEVVPDAPYPVTIDELHALFGEPRSLACQALRVDPTVRGEDMAIVLVGFDNAACLVEASYAGKGGREAFPQTLIHIDGMDGALDLGPDYVLTRVARDGTVLERSTVPIARYPLVLAGHGGDPGERGGHQAALGRLPGHGARRRPAAPITCAPSNWWRAPITPAACSIREATRCDSRGPGRRATDCPRVAIDVDHIPAEGTAAYAVSS